MPRHQSHDLSSFVLVRVQRANGNEIEIVFFNRFKYSSTSQGTYFRSCLAFKFISNLQGKDFCRTSDPTGRKENLFSQMHFFRPLVRLPCRSDYSAKVSKRDFSLFPPFGSFLSSFAMQGIHKKWASLPDILPWYIARCEGALMPQKSALFQSNSGVLLFEYIISLAWTNTYNVPQTSKECSLERGAMANQHFFRGTRCLSSHLRRAENRLISESGECGVSRQECLPWLRYF